MPISELAIGVRYPIEVAKQVTTRFGDAILLSLRNEEQALVKVFLPRRYTEAFTGEALDAINRGAVILHLIYDGKCGQSGAHRLSIE